MIGYTQEGDCVAVARVVNTMAKMQIDRLSRQAGASYEARYFDSEQQAVKWLDEKLKMVLDYKFISYGPDTLTTEGSYPFATGKVMDRPAPRTGLARDDVCSWE